MKNDNTEYSSTQAAEGRTTDHACCMKDDSLSISTLIVLVNFGILMLNILS